VSTPSGALSEEKAVLANRRPFAGVRDDLAFVDEAGQAAQPKTCRLAFGHRASRSGGRREFPGRDPVQ
jgi:hypothetical protein